MRKTKIVCTLGPASSSEEVMKDMFLAGMSVGRINFSHGTHGEHAKKISTFRRVRDSLGYAAAVLLDTKGPEIRTVDFEDGKITVDSGSHVTVTTREVLGTDTLIPITYKPLPNELKKDDFILINDGMIKLKVLSAGGTDIECIVINGGDISNHKGVNIPNVKLQMDYLSRRDKADLLFGIEQDVDYVAASFVRRADDVKTLRTFLEEKGGSRIKIISKIENIEGIDNFEEILEVSDGIMVARGDMGVEVDFEMLPGIQKHFIKRCNESGKIVITATQMLESMISNPVPTRAEITDVANAVFDGTSAVMLSGESAVGAFPVESVAAMAKITKQAEKDMGRIAGSRHISREMDSHDTTNAVGHAACTLAKDIKADALIAISKSGYTASRMSKFRPAVQIISPTPSQKTFHQLALQWGVRPVLIRNHSDLDELVRDCIDECVKLEWLKSGDKIVISAGVPINVPGKTNMVMVETV